MAKEIAVSASVDVGKNITDMLEKLAAQIGTTVDKLYPLYVKQQVIEGWMFIIMDSLALAIGLVLLALTVREITKGDDDIDTVLTLGVPAGVICMFAGIAALVGFGDAVSKILNPEYHAVHQIIKDVSGMVR